ncbi:MAG: NAD(P)/FAD-dependent oxidoreductase [Acidimicrobiia bacterium]
MSDPAPEHVDVVIVGAGPAGCAAALSLLQHSPGLSVLIADKASFPRDKCCGDGLGPGVVDVVNRLGITDVVAGERAVGGCTVIGPGGVQLDAQLPTIDGRVVEGFVIPRLVFDARLHDAAVARGARSESGWRFVGTWMSGDRRHVEFETPHGRVVLGTALLVGADGASSRVRKALGVARNSDRRTGIAIRAYVDVIAEPADARRLLFEFNEELLPAYAWYFPGTGPQANIGLGVLVADHKKRDIDLNALLERFCSMLSKRGFEISEPRLVRTYLLPFATRLPRLAHERAVLIGDAGSMINPLSGEGIFYGMAAGEGLGSIAEALKGTGDIDDALTAWEHQLRERFVWHYRSNALAQFLLRSKWWSTVVIRAADRDPKVLAAAVQLLFGEGVIKLSTTGRILWAGLRRPATNKAHVGRSHTDAADIGDAPTQVNSG